MLSLHPQKKINYKISSYHPQLATTSTRPRPGSKGAGGTTGMMRTLSQLSRAEDVQDDWSTTRRIGAGYANLGNTCFMNSVLKCLTHCAPLAEYLLTRDLRSSSPHGGFCPIVATQEHVRSALSASGKVIRPAGLARSLKQINKSFRLGRQEDAHEFLRCLLDSLQEACLKGLKPKPVLAIQMTTWVSRIFGGQLRSQVTCLTCQHPSRTLDPIFDLSLEINRGNSLEQALRNFTRAEYLDGDNAYKCEKCHTRGRAEKRFSIDILPKVLTGSYHENLFFPYIIVHENIINLTPHGTLNRPINTTVTSINIYFIHHVFPS